MLFYGLSVISFFVNRLSNLCDLWCNSSVSTRYADCPIRKAISGNDSSSFFP